MRREHVKEGAVIIDVGINRVEDPATPKGYRITGDVAFEEVAPKTRAITPVPGGVGPMTVAMLMANTVTACQIRQGNLRLTMHSFHYQRGKLTCESYPLDKAAERYGTPLYVYSSHTIVDHYQAARPGIARAAS